MSKETEKSSQGIQLGSWIGADAINGNSKSERAGLLFKLINRETC